MKIKDLCADISYSLISGTNDEDIKDLVYDSRDAREGTAFICLVGSHTDGHKYIREAFDNGCRCFVVCKDTKDVEELKDKATFICCEDSKVAFSYMSQAYFGYPARKLKLIGITGTKGKTTTSYMIASILKAAGEKVGVIGTMGCVIEGKSYVTYNTTPIAYELQYLLSEMVKAGCGYAVMECSSLGFLYKRLEGSRLATGIFLNLTPDHIGAAEHESFEEYLWSKAMIFPMSERMVYNAASEHLDEVFKEAGVDRTAENIVSFALDKDELSADYIAGELNYKTVSGQSGMSFLLSGKGISERIDLSMPGAVNVQDATAAAVTCLGLGISMDAVKEGLSKVMVKGRMETVYNENGVRVIVDYAHNEDSTANLLDTLRNYDPGRVILVFGCGGERTIDRRIGMGRQAAMYADFSVITSDNPRREDPETIIDDIEEAYLKAGGKEDSYVRITDRAEAIYHALKHAKEGDLIAVIGKGHEEYQEINGVKHHFSDKEEILKAAERISNEACR